MSKMRIFFISLLVSFISLYPFCEIFPQKIINHNYPRIATLQWGGGTVDWLSRFDLVITRNRDSTILRQVQQLHPEIYILSTTDWNNGEALRLYVSDPIPDQWRVKTQNGAFIMANSTNYSVDYTEYCGLYNGEKAYQALARLLLEKTDWNGFDGINSDGLWTFPWTATTSTGIDLDRNGLNDYTETGKGKEWVKQKWQSGCRSVMENLRERYKTKWGNPFQKFIAYWSLTDTMSSGIANGIGWENAPDHGPNIPSWKSLITQWEAAGPSSNINYVCAGVRYDSGHAPARKKDYFRFVRWMLGITLMSDSYFMMTDDDGGHWYNFYYDEFDVDLGYPTGAMQVLSNGCWVRYFNNGVVIVNPTNSRQIVTSSNIQAMTGYAGPYYHFRGNQDPVTNNGSLFTSDTLVSTAASWPGNTQNVGDGIILVKKPTTVVSDIIVDNAYAGTSPGSPEATLTGFSWDNGASSNRANPLWYTGPYMDSPNLPYVWRSQYAPSGNGSSTAGFRPTINISGRYNVYEWHGWRGTYSTSYSEATNVPCRIFYADGTKDITIDQTKNYGQWNLVGTFAFKAGGNASVTITNNANGYVIADAFKFEYVVEETGNAPESPNLNSPSNGAFNVVNPPTMIWNSTAGAVSYVLEISPDSLFSNIAYKDSALAGLSRQTIKLSGNTIYFWRVKAKNQWGESGWSNIWRFTTEAIQTLAIPPVPTLLSPSNGMANVQVPLTFQWNASSGAANYHLQLATDSLFSLLVLDDTTLINTTIVVSALTESTTYYWHVRAKNAAGYSPFSVVCTFITTMGANVENQVIMISRKNLDFGKVAIGSTKIDSVIIENLSKNAVRTKATSSVSQQFIVNPDTLNISPLTSKKVYISFTPVGRSSFNDLIRFEDAGLSYNDTIKVTGKGVNPPRIRNNPGAIIVTSQPTDYAKTDSFLIYNEGDLDLTISNVSTTSSAFNVTPNSAIIGVEDSLYFYLHTNMKSKEPHNGYILISSNAKVAPDSIRVDVEISGAPTEFILENNYPNPFNPITTINYQLPSEGYVSLTIFNALGQEIKVLVDEVQSAGTYSVNWDASNINGNSLSSGIYFYRLYISRIKESFVQVKKMLLLK